MDSQPTWADQRARRGRKGVGGLVTMWNARDDFATFFPGFPGTMLGLNPNE